MDQIGPANMATCFVVVVVVAGVLAVGVCVADVACAVQTSKRPNIGQLISVVVLVCFVSLSLWS